MKVRFFEYERDYPIVCTWFEKWGYAPIRKENLPRHGLIASNEGYDIGAVWLYQTDAKVGLLEGSVMNPDVPKKYRKGGHEFLLTCMQNVARTVGCLDVWVLSKDPYTTAICKKAGFTCLEKQFNVLLKRL